MNFILQRLDYSYRLQCIRGCFDWKGIVLIRCEKSGAKFLAGNNYSMKMNWEFMRSITLNYFSLDVLFFGSKTWCFILLPSSVPFVTSKWWNKLLHPFVSDNFACLALWPWKKIPWESMSNWYNVHDLREHK